jgi:hypothetical protein
VQGIAMKSFARHIGVSVFGILSFALTVVAIVVLERLTEFDFFTFSIWFVVPVGAAITGAAAASGYYFGSLLFHVKPGWFVLVEMVIVAALAQLAIYYTEYATMVLADGRTVSSLVSFTDYLHVYLTTTHMRIGRIAALDTGEVGSFGYWLAVIQFVGFLAGGVAVFMFLKNHPTCQSCGRYLRKLLKHNQQFNNQGEFAQYYDTVFRHPVDTPGFAEWMRWQPYQQPLKPGSILCITTLRGCAHCKTQLMSQDVKVFGGKQWRDVPKLTRHVGVPGGSDIRPVFKVG